MLLFWCFSQIEKLPELRIHGWRQVPSYIAPGSALFLHAKEEVPIVIEAQGRVLLDDPPIIRVVIKWFDCLE